VILTGVDYRMIEMKKITTRLEVHIKNAVMNSDIKEFTILKIKLPTADNDLVKEYVGYGIVRKVNIIGPGEIILLVDINIVSPVDSKVN
jgi:hypothetical protein